MRFVGRVFLKADPHQGPSGFETKGFTTVGGGGTKACVCGGPSRKPNPSPLEFTTITIAKPPSGDTGTAWLEARYPPGEGISGISVGSQIEGVEFHLCPQPSPGTFAPNGPLGLIFPWLFFPQCMFFSHYPSHLGRGGGTRRQILWRRLGTRDVMAREPVSKNLPHGLGFAWSPFVNFFAASSDSRMPDGRGLGRSGFHVFDRRSATSAPFLEIHGDIRLLAVLLPLPVSHQRRETCGVYSMRTIPFLPPGWRTAALPRMATVRPTRRAAAPENLKSKTARQSRADISPHTGGCGTHC